MNCEHWRDCNVPGGGCCDAGLYGGTPSLGTCRRCLAGPGLPKQPVPQQPTLLGKAISYLKAEVSAIVSKLSDDEYQARLSQCRTCKFLSPSDKEGEIGWCKGCGCGQNSRAELTVKAKMPAATCPLKKWDSGR